LPTLSSIARRSSNTPKAWCGGALVVVMVVIVIVMVVVTAATTAAVAAAVAEWRRQTDHGRAAVVSTGHGRQRRRRDGETCGGCGHCPVVHPARRIAAMLIVC